MVAAPVRKVGRVFSPALLVLAGLAFLLPFATVSCAPGAFGGAAPGGKVTYTGAHLLVGAQPEVKQPENPSEVPPGMDDRIGPAPALLVAFALIIAAAVLAVRVRGVRARRGQVAAVVGVAAVALLVNQALVEAELRLRVTEQIGASMPAGKSAGDFVNSGDGFRLCLLLLVVVGVANAIGWWRARPRPAMVSHDYG